MAAHRKPKPRSLTGSFTGSLTGNTARTALTLALAGAASTTLFEGSVQADPRLTPAQVKAKVDKLYHEAEVATEQYNGAREKARKARGAINELQDEAARKTAKLDEARTALGRAATEQYRSGSIDPTVQLALADDPEEFLDRVSRGEQTAGRHANEIKGVREQLRELEQLRSAAADRFDELQDHQAELKRHKTQITKKLDKARELLASLSPEQQASYAAGEPGAPGTSDTSGARASREMPRGSLKAPNARAAQAVSFAYSALGSPYVWGAAGPNAFDCSGLTQAAYRSAGVSLPRTTYTQINAGQRVSRGELAPGDLVFFYSGISHVGIYVGGGQMIHAPNPSAPVRLAPVDSMPFAGATRVV
ncbi:C40 family peptidase [Streptomyces indicus]|uniref:C40 family peptidase n=1 Tax=Streptomyces indicus TaxID=417292 RepID=UPI001FE94246|nr:C40 family peptidase [Streptomyces indicus]